VNVMKKLIEQSRNPSGTLGRIMLRIMNNAHRSLTAWGLLQVQPCENILDVSCGGGNAIFTMAKKGTFEHIYGIDFSQDAIAFAMKKNQSYINNGVVSIECASVLELPFYDDFFDAITTFQSHYHWPNILKAMREIRRVLKTGGQFVMVAEKYKIKYHMEEFNNTEKTKELFLRGGFKNIVLLEDKANICISGYK